MTRRYVNGEKIRRNVPIFLSIVRNGVQLVDSIKKKRPTKIRYCECGNKIDGGKRRCIDCRDKIEKEKNMSYSSLFYKELCKKHI